MIFRLITLLQLLLFLHVVGGAANIALANYNDIVFASTDARFKYPFADLGLTPELGSSFMMPQAVGMTKAKYMFFLGEWFSAEDAKEMGLVVEVFSPEQLMPQTIAVAEKLAKKDAFAISRCKKLVNSHAYKLMDDVMDAENDAILETIIKATEKDPNHALGGLRVMLKGAGKASKL
jgi:enoyl-CoA hydratase/carnithine racemase